MATLSVTTVTTANSTTDLTLNTGNTSAGRVIVNAGGGFVFASNSTVNNFVINTTHNVFRGNIVLGSNSTVNNFVVNTSGNFLTGNLTLTIGGVEEFFVNTTQITCNNNCVPSVSNTYDLGTTTLRWRNIYTNDLNLANRFGDYTIVEGEDDLFLYNNKKGKVYKFALIEVDANSAPPKAT